METQAEQLEGQTMGQTQQGEEREVTLTEKTKVPLGVACAMIITVAAGLGWIKISLSEMNREVAAIRKELNQRFSRDAFEIWVLKMKIQNPNLVIPEITKNE